MEKNRKCFVFGPFFSFGRKRKSLLACLLTVCMCMPVLAWGQYQKVSIQVKQASVPVILQEIKKQTNLNFVYSPEQVKALPKVDVQVTDSTVEEVLRQILAGSGLEYRFDSGSIIIRKAQASQPQTLMRVMGKVTDEKGQPLPGVTIIIQGTFIGTSTDVDGRYSMALPGNVPEPVLVYSFIGMKQKEIAYKGQKEINVTLQPTIKEMEEVVVTGYSNVVKGNYTGAATTVKAKDILMAGVSSIDQMLQGVVPGMLVMNQTGMVGATPKIRVRGTSTLLGSQEPVWVVDGVVQRDPQPFNSDENLKFSVDADDIKELAGNAISWLNPNDIETITVLKDASATAIYGSQAANGVIVITTKKAQVGRVVVSYNGDFSIGQRPGYRLYDLMNSAERMQLSKEVYEEKRFVDGASGLSMGFENLLERYRNKEATIADLQKEYNRMARQNTDWFDILFRNSFNHAHNLSISGGSEKLQNRTSFSYSQQNGEAKGNKMTQFTATSNTTVNLWKQVTLNLLLNGSSREVEGFAYGVDPFNYAYGTSRTIPCYQEDKSLYYHQKQGRFGVEDAIYNYNIQNEKANTGSENKLRTWSATFDLKWNILAGLEYQGVFAYISSSSDTKQWATERSYYISQIRGYDYGEFLSTDKETGMTPLPMGGMLETDLTNTTTVTARNSLVYNKLFKDKHRMTLQLGIETNAVKTKGETNQRYGYMPDRGETFNNPPLEYTEEGGESILNTVYATGSHSILNRVDNKLSEFGMVVYSYDDRYVLNANARVDASNRFGQDKNKRFQPTWSVGTKWRITNESFARGKWWLNNLELYGSYGYQGNAVSSVSPELITRFTNAMRYDWANTQEIVSVPYPDLGWEKTKTWNIGVDGSLLKGRLNFTFNYFKKTSDVLSSRAIPYENGASNGIVFGTTMKNTGYDLVVNVVPLQLKDFSWQLSVNTSVTRNSVYVERANTVDDYTNGTCLLEGVPYSTFYSYVFTGLDEKFGHPTFRNITQYGKRVTFTTDETVKNITDILAESGKFTPDFSGGLNTMFKYKNISLYALFAVQWGGHGRLPNLYDMSNGSKGLPREGLNFSKKLINRWKQPGDKTDIPSLPGTGMEDMYMPSIENPVVNASIYNRYEIYNLSDTRVANTDFIRCRQLSLSYEFNGEWMKRAGIGYLQLKASMTNPFMWVSDKKWEGLDPETANWPTRRVTSFSLSLMF